ncbi:hypothetical protein Cgig2_025244 [Carnegiea gigantea]|uniref:Uncharacterized protein n=1 Tax=Carnegiea gigantea TaxID=171969 RepID=A0A9Q1GWK0_9CARY|nr:hypothetical protein Cgig2_025244 [Carnegiea gigantea]
MEEEKDGIQEMRRLEGDPTTQFLESYKVGSKESAKSRFCGVKERRRERGGRLKKRAWGGQVWLATEREGNSRESRDSGRSAQKKKGAAFNDGKVSGHRKRADKGQQMQKKGALKINLRYLRWSCVVGGSVCILRVPHRRQGRQVKRAILSIIVVLKREANTMVQSRLQVRR